MIIEYRKHIPGCPGEYCEPVAIGVCKADVDMGMLRFRCLKKETYVSSNDPLAEDQEVDRKCCIYLGLGDLIKCGKEIVQLRSVEQMERIADMLNSQLPSFEQYKEYPNKNTPQIDSDTDLYSI